MSSSSRFFTLKKELNRIRKQFLPKINPTGTYSDKQLALTIAYRVLSHAEIEAYLEDRAWDTAMKAKRDWDNTGKTCRTLLSLLAFSGEMMDLPPDSFMTIKGKKAISSGLKSSEKVTLAVNCFKKIIDKNHGVKEANILALLLPIGIDSDDLDSVLIATLNTFGEQRGLVAHSSAASYRTKQPPDPATELSRMQQITQGLLQIDELINKL